MSSNPGYADDSDEESYASGNLDHSQYSSNVRRDTRYPIHDACEFRDSEFLRNLIFVPVARKSLDSNNQDSSDDSDEVASDNEAEHDDGSSDEDSSGTDGENDTAAAAAAAMGHHPPKISIDKTGGNSASGVTKNKTELKSITIENEEDCIDGKGMHNESKTEDSISIPNGDQLLGNASDTMNTPQVLKDPGSILGMDISPVELNLPVNGSHSRTLSIVDKINIASDTVNKITQEPTREPSGTTDATAQSSTDIQRNTGTTNILVNNDTEKDKFSSDKRTENKPLDMKQPSYYCPYDLDERDEDDNTALHVAIHHRKLDHINLLLEAGASPNRKCDGSAPIQTIISIGAICAHKNFACDAVVNLQKFHADFTIRDDSQQTPLYLAAVCNLPSVVGIILNDPIGLQTLNVRSDRSGGRPLHAAAKFDTSKINVGVMSTGRSGPPPAFRHSSIQSQCMPSQNSIALNGSNGNATVGGATIAAAGASSKALLTQILLSTPGIEIDPINNYGRTPLHVACTRGNWPVARLLLEAGADPNLTDQRDFTPGAIAYKCGMSIPNDLIASLGLYGSGLPLALKGCLPPPRDLIIDPEGRSLLICHELCSQHMTCSPITRDGMEGDEPPPENVRRLSVLLNEDVGILRSAEFNSCRWEGECRRAAMTDVLKVHEYNYVEKISKICSQLPDHPQAIAHLDPDTAVSRWSFEAAMRAAGSVCEAVDRIMSGDFRNVFCAVRPPGHHAGPRGIVRCPNDPEGSHGFCLLNNVAVGAAYARSMYRNDGIKKVAIIDFDVHHGNGTEEIIRQLVPNTEKTNLQLPFASGQFETSRYHPWLDETDIHNVFFASTHGFGPRDIRFSDHVQPHQGGWFYPASGKGIITDAISSPSKVENPSLADFLQSQTWTRMSEVSRLNCCKVINVGLDLPRPNDVPGMQRVEVRDSYRKKIIPHLIDFDPDLIFISAGFDAHRRDSMNFGYVGMVEEDYEWVTQQLVKVANKCCNGRIVSVLEGGYKIHGGIVSPFARSVASHVRALVDGGNSRELYDEAEAVWEGKFEREIVEDREKKRLFKMERIRRPFAAGIGERWRNPSFSSTTGAEGVTNTETIDTDALLKEPLSQYTMVDVNQNSQSDILTSVDKETPTRKRRRNQVDYKELFEKIKEQEHQQKMVAEN